jgi:hypothetical protein
LIKKVMTKEEGEVKMSTAEMGRERRTSFRTVGHPERIDAVDPEGSDEGPSVSMSIFARSQMLTSVFYRRPARPT